MKMAARPIIKIRNLAKACAKAYVQSVEPSEEKEAA